MNNTKTLAIVAILTAATLVVGTVASTSAAFAFKKGHEENGNTDTAQIAKQKGSVSGFDNDLDQEALNVICTHPGENATCTSESG
jgi:hypothetical protein